MQLTPALYSGTRAKGSDDAAGHAGTVHGRHAWVGAQAASGGACARARTPAPVCHPVHGTVRQDRPTSVSGRVGYCVGR